MVKSSRLAKQRRNKAIKDRKDRQARHKLIVEEKTHFELQGHVMIQTGVGAFGSKNDNVVEK